MIADASPHSRDVGVPGCDAEDRRHLRAFRGVVQELAQLVARLDDARDSSGQLLTPAAAEILRQLATRRTMALASLRIGHAAPTPAQLGLLTTSGLVEICPRESDTAPVHVRLTVTGEFQVLLLDLPGILCMARSSVCLTVDELDVTARSLRSLRQALDRPGRPVRLVP